MILSNAHVQTLWGPRWRKLPVFERREEKIGLKDGDHIWLSWSGPQPQDQQHIYVLLHGLSGCHDSHYVRTMQDHLQQRGLSVVSMNARGALRPNDKAATYHAGEKNDIAEVVEHIHACAPQAQIHLAGFSLGGSRLLNYLADDQLLHNRVSSACAVCVPLQLDVCSDNIDQGLSYKYRDFLMKQLLEKLKEKEQHLKVCHPAEADKISALWPFETPASFWQFDDQIMAPLHGFKDVHDYYQQCSARPKLKQIETPTLLIQADDDPLIHHSVIPEQHELGANMTLEVRAGGHVGFVDGWLLKPRYWLEERLLSWWQLA